MTVWLFSYGTLRQPEVQQALFGRELPSVADTLFGFKVETVRITDAAVIQKSGSDRHPIIKRSTADQKVSGTALLLTEEDLEAADRYEVADYVRVAVLLASGRRAFVYIGRDELRHNW